MRMLLHFFRFFRCGKNALIVLYFNSVSGSKNLSGLNHDMRAQIANRLHESDAER